MGFLDTLNPCPHSTAGNFINDLAEQSPRHARALQLSQLQQELAGLERQDAEQAQTFQIARTRVEIELQRAVQAGTIGASAKETRLKRFDSLVAGPGGLTFAAAGISDGTIPLTKEQLERIPSGKVTIPPHLADRVGITFEQILAAAAQDVEAGLLVSDVLPGGDQSDDVGDISGRVLEDLERGPTLPEPKPSNLPPNSPPT